jgi:hypothetical protein
MKSYTVHRPRRAAGDPSAEAEATRFVKEGFCWPALFVPVIWLAYRMMWLVLAGYVAAVAAVMVAAGLLGLGGEVGGLVAMALQVALATEGNDLRRWTLRRRGHEFVATAFGPSLFEAELQYFRGWTMRTSTAREKAAAAEAEIAFRAPPPAPPVPPAPEGAPA